MKYLSPKEIEAINKVVIELSGGSFGVREPGMLESISIKPQSTLYETELYPDIYLKSAVTYEAIVNYHVFVDGNKRTAWACLARFLYLNGYKITATDKEMEDYTVYIATDNPELAEIAQWIKKKVKKI